MTIERQYYAVDFENDDYEQESDARRPVDDDNPAANTVSSQIKGSTMHAPVIDIDLPCRWVESTTPGHGHLYIDKAIGWDQYVALLQVLADVGIVEQGYVDASAKRMATFVRLPHVRKVKRNVAQLCEMGVHCTEQDATCAADKALADHGATCHFCNQPGA